MGTGAEDGEGETQFNSAAQVKTRGPNLSVMPRSESHPPIYYS